jgi:hypothetical protein
MDEQVVSSRPGGYATEIGQVNLMPLLSKNGGGLATNFAVCVHSFLYSYLCFIIYGRKQLAYQDFLHTTPCQSDIRILTNTIVNQY